LEKIIKNWSQGNPSKNQQRFGVIFWEKVAYRVSTKEKKRAEKKRAYRKGID